MASTDIAARRGARVVQANGIDIAFIEAGEGRPLVLLHGGLASNGPAWSGSTNGYFDHLQVLARHFRVIAPDTRGSGATINPNGLARFDTLADDVIGLIDELGLERPLLAGFSEGGATATLVALRRPKRLTALVNHAGFDYFDPIHMDGMIEANFRPLFSGRPGADCRS